MDVHEMRIGNWYSEFGMNYEKVNWIVLQHIHESIESFIWVQPIPLTEKWLLKFGFKWKQIKDLSSYTLPKLELYQYSSNNNKIFFEYADGEVELKYVHQLQNLYWELCGEEFKMEGEK